MQISLPLAGLQVLFAIDERGKIAVAVNAEIFNPSHTCTGTDRPKRTFRIEGIGLGLRKRLIGNQEVRFVTGVSDMRVTGFVCVRDLPTVEQIGDIEFAAAFNQLISEGS